MTEQPPTAFPEPYPDPAPTPAPAPVSADRPRRTRRLIAGFATTALVAGVGGVGAGYVVGHDSRGSTSATASNGTDRTATGNGPDIRSIPGYGWSWSEGGSQGDVPLPTDPYGGQGGSQGGGTMNPGTTSESTTKASGSQLTGLVRVVSTMKYDRARAAGTGMVLTSNGEVVTNHHVVEGSTSVQVKVMSTGRTYSAKVVGTDAKDDVAVLQLTGASGLSTVTTDNDPVSVGDAVTAVGDANGTVDHLSAAKGKVLATGQSITTQSEATASSERLTGLIKISSDVISGDSGGATYDSQGEVLGMTTAASSGSADVVGYAVPIAKVLRIADDLENGVTSSRYDYGSPAFLGVGLARSGATVQGVYAGTPAAKAGLSAGDRITAVDGTRVRSAAQLHTAIGQHSPGDQVSITWSDTAGDSHTATVTLGTGPVE
jgi:S1-C subfamily serine protease